MLKMLEHVPTLPTTRLGMRLCLLTMVRKSELLNATWNEVDFENAVWTIPKERMKRSKAHNVYLSRQALDIMIALKTCSGDSRYLLPSRYDSDASMSRATFNRTTMRWSTGPGGTTCRRSPSRFTICAGRARPYSTSSGSTATGSRNALPTKTATRLGGVYNKAEYEVQRRHMLQEWADLIDAWVDGRKRRPMLFPSSMQLIAPDPRL